MATFRSPAYQATHVMQQMQGNVGIRESSPTGSTFYIDMLLAAATPR